MLENNLRYLSTKNRDGTLEGRINEFIFDGSRCIYEGLKAIMEDSMESLSYSGYFEEKLEKIKVGVREF